MNIIQAFLLGTVQGVTEILPISSTAHLIILPKLLHFEDPGLAYDVILNFVSWIAILLFFWDSWLDLLVGALKFIQQIKNPSTVQNEFFSRNKRSFWILMYVIIGTIPSLLLGALFKKQVESVFRTPTVIGFSLILVGIILWLADYYGQKKRQAHDLSLVEVVSIGFAQALAIIPGVSRSGATISAGMLFGLTRQEAASYTFLLGAPIIVAATLVSIPKIIHTGLTLDLFVASVAAFGATYLTVSFLFSFIKKQSYTIFVVYRILLGITLLLFFR